METQLASAVGWQAVALGAAPVFSILAKPETPSAALRRRQMGLHLNLKRSSLWSLGKRVGTLPFPLLLLLVFGLPSALVQLSYWVGPESRKRRMAHWARRHPRLHGTLLCLIIGVLLAIFGTVILSMATSPLGYSLFLFGGVYSSLVATVLLGGFWRAARARQARGRQAAGLLFLASGVLCAGVTLKWLYFVG